MTGALKRFTTNFTYSAIIQVLEPPLNYGSMRYVFKVQITTSTIMATTIIINNEN
jgi:hypothetical protein